MVNQNAQVVTHAVSCHLVNMDAVLYQKQHAVQMASTAVQMVTHVMEVFSLDLFD